MVKTNRQSGDRLVHVEPYQRRFDAAWDELVLSSPDGWVFGLRAWQRLILAVEQWSLTEQSLVLMDGKRLVGVMPLQFDTTNERLASSGFGGCGPMLLGTLEGVSRDVALKRLIEGARTLAATLGASAFEFSLCPATKTSLNARWGVNPFVSLGGEDLSTHSRLVPLDISVDALWARLSKGARQEIRRARQRGYRVHRSDWSGMTDEYYRVHCETYHRTGATPHPRSYFDGIARELAPAGQSVLWVATTEDGNPVAFHNDARLNKACMYHTGCCETAHLEGGVNYLLLWASLQGALEDGFEWYDVGEVFPAGTGKARGLTVFKSKFGGEIHRLFRTRFPAATPDSATSTPASQQEEIGRAHV